MKKFLTVAACAAGLMIAAPASAITYVADWDTDTPGEIGLVFGDTNVSDANGPGIWIDGGDAGDGASTHTWDGTNFVDTFTFTLPTGLVGFSGITIAFSASTDVDFGVVDFNGTALTVINDAMGSPVSSYFTMFQLPVSLGGPQVLTVRGTSGGNGGWSGYGTFNVVPEPGTWALMIMGFAGMGVALRRSRQRTAAFA